MSVHRLPNVRDSQREASEWIARLNADDVSAEDLERFEAWKGAHPLHAASFEELSRTWRRFEQAGPLVRAVAFGQSMGSNLDTPRSSKRPFLVALAAAALVATVLAGFYLRLSATPSTFKTAVGDQATVSLPDGSSMVLNSNSVVRVEYSQRRRIVHLDQGEAFFSVAHDTKRPFWVTSDTFWVRAVGTQFDVYRKTAAVQVTVNEGTIRAGATRRSVPMELADEPGQQALATLTAGQQADLSGGSATTRELSPDDLMQAIGWRGGTLFFANRPLEDVVAELNRYTPRRIVLEDDSLRALPVGGTFHASPQGAETLVRLLEQSFDLRVERDGNRILVHGGAHGRSQ